jgi:hypothetical protein
MTKLIGLILAVVVCVYALGALAWYGTPTWWAIPTWLVGIVTCTVLCVALFAEVITWLQASDADEADELDCNLDELEVLLRDRDIKVSLYGSCKGFTATAVRLSSGLSATFKADSLAGVLAKVAVWVA